MVVLEAAVLIEAGWNDIVDEIWLTYAPRETVIKRLKGSKGLSEKQVGQRIDSQISFLEQRRHAKVIIENTNTLDALRETVSALWKTHQKDKSSTNG
jgi:dephospho-CoA kinase